LYIIGFAPRPFGLADIAAVLAGKILEALLKPEKNDKMLLSRD
jgi:hypothetical protein